MSSDPGQRAPGTRGIYEDRRLEAIAARWDAKARTWDHELEDPACHLNEDDAYPRFLREICRIIEPRRDFCAGQGVIDAGCGTGQVLAHVLPAFMWGAGVDISEEMVRVAREKRIARARFIVGDCFKLSAVCPKAGAVLSRGVLLSHYGREQGEALVAAGKEALVPGGFLVFDFLNEAGRAKQLHSPEDKTYFTPEEVCSIARRAGFRTAMILGKKDRRVLVMLAEGD